MMRPNGLCTTPTLKYVCKCPTLCLCAPHKMSIHVMSFGNWFYIWYKYILTNTNRRGIHAQVMSLSTITSIMHLISLLSSPPPSPDKNHTGLCALGFVLIQHNVPILVNIGPQCSVCSISGTMSKCNDPFVENIGDSGIKARTQAPTMTDHPPSHLTFPPWHHPPNCNVSLHQWQPISSPMLGHITPKVHLIM